MENNKTERRVNIIKEALKNESSGVLFAGMTAKQRAQLYSIFNVSENEIIGYYEDIMNLGKTLLASVRGKFSNQGLLFLKDAFVYRKKSINGITKVYYDDILSVETGSFGTKVDYNYKEKTASIFLSGIAYSDSNKVIPDLLIRLKGLNSAKVTSGQRVKKSEVKKETKREEKQDNIDKWNEHIRECAKKNRIAQIQHLDDYMQVPSIANILNQFGKILLIRLFYVQSENSTILNPINFSVYGEEETFEGVLDSYPQIFDFPIKKIEIARVLSKIIPFIITTNTYDKEWWTKKFTWNSGSNYDCDDSYGGKRYFFTTKEEGCDSSIKTEEDIFVQKDEIQYLPDRALLYLADVIDIWRDKNLSDIVRSYDLWKKKREFILGYEECVIKEIQKRGLLRFRPKSEFDSDGNDESKYGEEGEKDVEYAIKWLPNTYKKIERFDWDGIHLYDSLVSDESQEIDHIVVGPNGVFVIETKHLSGSIEIDENNVWTRVKNGETEIITNPVQQVDRHHLIVKSILSESVDVEDIHDVICLSHRKCTIKGTENSPVPVVKLEMLGRHISGCKSQKEYSEADIERILEKIEEHRI